MGLDSGSRYGGRPCFACSLFPSVEGAEEIGLQRRGCSGYVIASQCLKLMLIYFQTTDSYMSSQMFSTFYGRV
jgi:hypothetical protein